jgi:hypothetical protein
MPVADLEQQSCTLSDIISVTVADRGAAGPARP